MDMGKRQREREKEKEERGADFLAFTSSPFPLLLVVHPIHPSYLPSIARACRYSLYCTTLPAYLPTCFSHIRTPTPTKPTKHHDFLFPSSPCPIRKDDERRAIPRPRGPALRTNPRARMREGPDQNQTCVVRDLRKGVYSRVGDPGEDGEGGGRGREEEERERRTRRKRRCPKSTRSFMTTDEID